MTTFNASFFDFLKRSIADWPEHPQNDAIDRLLRGISRWRQQIILNAYLREHGAVVYGGLFKGMDYVSRASEGALLPRLLGTYESELHPHLQAIAAKGLDCVVDVGCAEGYYAVGLARLLPEVTVHAHDIDEAARFACAELAAKNEVAERVIVGGEVRPDGFQAYAGRRTLVLVDAEGAEVDILDPAQSPALAGMSLIVETHDIYRAGALETLTARFAATHQIQRIDQAAKVYDPPPRFSELAHLDQLLAVWEWRIAPTPWLVMTPNSA